jgi:hypothetical protein
MARIGVYSMPMGRGSDFQYEEGLRAEVAHYFPLLRDYVDAMWENLNRNALAFCRSLSCASPQSASCSENFAIPRDVSGQTLRDYVDAMSEKKDGLLIWVS